jgi:hypothetical protein
MLNRQLETQDGGKQHDELTSLVRLLILWDGAVFEH